MQFFISFNQIKVDRVHLLLLLMLHELSLLNLVFKISSKVELFSSVFLYVKLSIAVLYLIHGTVRR
jgi:hypothetical protein